MIQDKSEIISIIEILRNQMANTIELKKILTDPEVVEISQLLDESLNDYYRFNRYKYK